MNESNSVASRMTIDFHSIHIQKFIYHGPHLVASEACKHYQNTVKTWLEKCNHFHESDKRRSKLEAFQIFYSSVIV